MAKRKTVYMVTIDNTGLWCVRAGTVERTADEGRTVFVRITTETEGQRDSVVVDRAPADLYPTHQEAAACAVRRCYSQAERHALRAAALIQGEA